LQGGQPPLPLRAEGGRLVAGGKASSEGVKVHGISWSGFDTVAGFVALPGLQSTESNASWEATDFVTSVHQLRLLGFTAVRLPFTFEQLTSTSPADVTRRCSDKPQDLLQQLAQHAVDPNRKPEGKLPTPPKLYSPPYNSSAAATTCNSYVPQGPTPLTRLLWTVEFLVRSGMYVVLDYHPSSGLPQQQNQQDQNSPSALAGPVAFAAAWQRLATALMCLPAWEDELSGRVLLDLLSNPSAFGLRWRQSTSATSGATRSLGDYYLAVLDAITAVEEPDSSTGFLFMLQGTSEQAAAGGSFIVDQQQASKLGVDEAGSFFGNLVSRPYKGRVVLSPRLDGLSTAETDAGPAAGTILWEALSANW